jgi:hypothetical protein
MAISQAVGLNVGGEFGFKRPAFAPVPIMETIKSFNTTTAISGSLANTSSRVIVISSPKDFIIPVGNTSTQQVLDTYGTGTNDVLKAWTLPFKQSITISNTGNSVVTIFPRDPYRPTFSIPPPVLGQLGAYPVLHSAVGSYTLAAGASQSVELAYYSTDPGEYTSFLTIESTAGLSTVTLFTNQIVLEETFDFRLTSSTFLVNTTELGKAETKTIGFTPVFNGIPNTDFPLDFTTSLVGDPGWTVSTGTNSFNIRWDPDVVNNSIGTYTSILTVSSGGVSNTVTNISTVNINYSLYKNLSTWSSAAAGNNSIIGISFDLFNGIKTVTIGVGAGGDGTPIYSEGGNIFAVMNNLKIGSGTIDTPYPYWSTVCSIPLTEAGTYLSGELGGDDLPVYIKKTTDGLNYADYFGFEQSVGSMFVVTYNGYDLVNIEINNLRELSGNTAFDLTMESLIKAFHYFDPARVNQLEAARLADPRTRLFRGFVDTSQSFVNSTGTNVIGSGSGATFDVTTYPNYIVNVGSVGTSYNTNDTIKILGSALGGVTPTNDLLITIAASSGSVTGITTSTGISATWIVDTSLVPLPT